MKKRVCLKISVFNLQSMRKCICFSVSPTRFFYEQHFHKQHQAETGKKIKQKLSNTLRLDFCYLKNSRFLHPRYHLKVTEDQRIL